MERTLILQGFELLKAQKNYHQAAVVQKLNFLETKISKAGFNNIVNGKSVSRTTLLEVCKGMQELVMAELGYAWQATQFINLPTKGWIPTEVGQLTSNDPSLIAKPGFAFHQEGRLEISQKVEFFSKAQQEVVEFGVSLNTFSNYFFSRSDAEFKNPVAELLEKGVHFKCFLLNPDCAAARVYFNDSKLRQGDEKKIREAIERLSALRNEFNALNFKGNFDVFTYKHIPNNHFLAVDPASNMGKMMVSHYIFGEPRAKCPVIEMHKKQNPTLFRRYHDSFLRLIDGATPLP